VKVGESEKVHVRELRPSDFTYLQLLRNKNKSSTKILEKLILNPEVLGKLKAKNFRHFAKWSAENIFSESVFSVESWLEVAFHLNKQRWDNGLDWLEQQPMSKIKAMISINKKMAEQQEGELKKTRRKR
jgi:hypothetical protein